MKLNQEEFAKEVLWQVALARAEIQEVKLLVCEVLASQTGKSAETFQKQWEEKKNACAKERFLKSAEAVGLKNSPIPDHNGDFH
jgi:hypothetical protein